MYSANLMSLVKIAARVGAGPDAKAIMKAIYKYAPDLKDREVGLDDDLTSYTMWNTPWSEEEKKAVSDMIYDAYGDNEDSEDSDLIPGMLNCMFDRPRFAGLDESSIPDLAWDLERKYKRDLSDPDGEFYRAKTVNELLTALNNAPALK